MLANQVLQAALRLVRMQTLKTAYGQADTVEGETPDIKLEHTKEAETAKTTISSSSLVFNSLFQQAGLPAAQCHSNVCLARKPTPRSLPLEPLHIFNMPSNFPYFQVFDVFPLSTTSTNQ